MMKTRYVAHISSNTNVDYFHIGTAIVSQCIGTGSQANGNPGGRFAVVAGDDAVGVTAQLSARHIA